MHPVSLIVVNLLLVLLVVMIFTSVFIMNSFDHCWPSPVIGGEFRSSINS